VTDLSLPTTKHQRLIKMHEDFEAFRREGSLTYGQELVFCRPAFPRAELPEIVDHYCCYAGTVTSDWLQDGNRRLGLISMRSFCTREMPVEENEEVMVLPESLCKPPQ
jgi:hypothetical protein